MEMGDKSLLEKNPVIRTEGQTFLRLVLPLNLLEDQLEERSRRIEQMTDRDGMKQWELATFLMSDFLPHIADHMRIDPSIFPTMSTLGSIWRLRSLHLNDLNVFDQTWICKIPLNVERRESEVPFRVSEGLVAIFRPGLAFAILQITPVSNSLASWLDLCHYLRFYMEGRARKIGLGGGTFKYTVADFLQSIVRAVLLENEELPTSLKAAAISDEVSSFKDLGMKPIGEPFTKGELLRYSSTFVDDFGANQNEEELLARIKGGFHSIQGQGLASDSRFFEEPNSRVTYQSNQTFVFSIESSSFVAVNAPDDLFSNQNLPDHLEKTYFLLFLLIHLQRFAITGLSARIVMMTTEAVQPENEKRIRGQLERVVQLDREFLEFSARSYYLQVCQQYHHHLYYNNLRKLIQIESLYAEIKEEITSLKAFVNSLVQQEADRRANLIQVAVMLITAIFIPAGVLVALFAPKIHLWPGIDRISPTDSLWLTLLIITFFIGSMLVVYALSRGTRHREREEK